MKKFTYQVALAFGLFMPVCSAFGQITVTQADMPAVGVAIAIDSDVTPTVMPGNAGPSQAWNFLGLHHTKALNVTVVAASATPYASKFPGSNVADSMQGVPGYSYFSSISNSFSMPGSMPTVGGFEFLLNFSPNFEQIALPAVYGGTDGGMTVGISNADPISYLTYDSVKGRLYITYSDTIDAWGSMQTPAGTFNVLRQKHYEVDLDSTFLHDSFSHTWIFYSAVTTVIPEYRWYTNGIRYIIATMLMDSANTTPQSVCWYAGPAGINEVTNAAHALVYPNPCNAQVSFQYSKIGAKNISVFDITGRQITETSFRNGVASLNTSSYSSGIYIYKVTDASGLMLDCGKFSVQ